MCCWHGFICIIDIVLYKHVSYTLSWYLFILSWEIDAHCWRNNINLLTWQNDLYSCWHNNVKIPIIIYSYKYRLTSFHSKINTYNKDECFYSMIYNQYEFAPLFYITHIWRIILTLTYTLQYVCICHIAHTDWFISSCLSFQSVIKFYKVFILTSYLYKNPIILTMSH